MPLSGHTLSSTTLIIILLSVQLFVRISETKSTDSHESSSDLTYSDSNHGPQTAAAHQQVLYIDHGGGAISQIRRTQFFGNPSLPSVPSLPFRPHAPHFPNPNFENNLTEDPYNNFPEDIPRIDRRNGPTHDHIGAQPPSVPFIPQNNPQPIPQPFFQPLQPPAQPVLHHSVQHFPQPIAQPIPQSFPQPFSQPIPQPLPQPLPQPFPHHISQPNVFPISQPIGHGFHQPIQHQTHQPVPQPLPQPIPQSIAPPNSLPFRHPIDDIEDERFLINNEIERIPKSSNQMKPARREPPVQEPPPPPPPPAIEQPGNNPFFNFDGPELFGGLDSPFNIFGGQNGPEVFQRRRLTTNNGPDQSQNQIGYQPFPFNRDEDKPSVTNWPKIFKFTDGRSNLYEFEKQKKQNKIKFSSKETFFDHISRDSFLILHGGTFAQ